MYFVIFFRYKQVKFYNGDWWVYTPLSLSLVVDEMLLVRIQAVLFVFTFSAAGMSKSFCCDQCMLYFNLVTLQQDFLTGVPCVHYSFRSPDNDNNNSFNK